jgi:curli production assembly/transport component CsgF
MEKNMRLTRAALLIASLISGMVHATELVYTPVNPAFGGNPNNGPVLLNTAQAQNDKKDPESRNGYGGYTPPSPLQQFNDTLQRSILNQVASAATSRIMGPGGQLVQGTVDTGNFRISIIDMGGGMLQITTTDKTTGAMTSFQVSQ